MFDLTVVRNTLTIAEEVCEVLKGHLEQNCSLRSELEGLKTFPELTEEIESALGGTTHGYIRKGTGIFFLTCYWSPWLQNCTGQCQV